LPETFGDGHSSVGSLRWFPTIQDGSDAMKAEQFGTSRVQLPVLERDIPPDVQRILAGYQNRITSYLLRIGCLDGLDGFARDRSLPHQFLTYMQKVMELFDESNRFFVNYLRRDGVAVPCQEGCAHCCQNMPAGATLVELLYFYHGMHQSGSFSRLFRRCLEEEQVLTRLFLQCQDQAEASAPVASCREEVLQLYQDLGQLCRFSQDNLCRLYPYRPFACRMHFSLSPAYWCNPRHFQFPHAVIINLEPGNSVYDALGRIERRLQIRLSGILVCGILELAVNVMRFDRIRWRS
jgi:Fe-S-cluster containining protein